MGLFVLVTSLLIFFLGLNVESADRCADVDMPIPTPVVAEALTPSLSRESMHNKTITVSIEGKPRTINYVEYPATIQPAKGRVLFACGGPGSRCAQGSPPGIPSNYTVVTMDYLGIGENRRHNEPNLMSIESQAQALAGVADAMREPNLIMYGQSFGTTVVTAAAALMTDPKKPASGTTRLKGVLLEGVVGKGGKVDYEKNYKQAADKIWDRLTATEKKTFIDDYKTAMNGLTSEQKRIVDILLVIEILSGPQRLISTLRNVKNFVSSTIEHFANSKRFTEMLKSGDSRAQFLAAGCQIYGKSRRSAGKKIFGGTVEVYSLTNPSFCNCATVPKIWDPKDHQIFEVPVLYLNGERDPATPEFWARTHYEGQRNHRDQVFITLKNQGHWVLGSLTGCQNMIFDSLFRGDLTSLKAQKSSIETLGCPATSPKSLPTEGIQ